MPDRQHSEAVKARFIKAIKTIAQEQYATQSEASIVRSLGIDTSGYYRLNRANNYPTLEYCIDLCTQYGIAADWLFLGKGQMKAKETKTVSALELLKAGVQALEAEEKNKKSKRKAL